MYNYYYNFKNTVRHFIDIDSLYYPSQSMDNSIAAKKLTWTKPFKYMINKEGDGFRTLKIPNILSYIISQRHFESCDNFENPNLMDMDHKRLEVMTLTGEFKIGSFDKWLESDFEKLCVYDVLIKLDIKEFYGRIYTHYLGLTGDAEDRYLTTLNNGATNGLIMGNYLSLFFAEKHLAKISEDIKKQIIEKNINCEYNYFSDDFYFFCNRGDKNEIVSIFDKVLDKYDLERNIDKSNEWDYLSYNNYYVISRFWKKLIAKCNTARKAEDTPNKLVFINQLLYRASRLKDHRQKKVFICGFFKTKYFRQKLELRKYSLREYDIHQLCFLIREVPEILLYCVDKLREIDKFDATKFKKFFAIRYKEALKKPFHDEQLYYFYGMYSLGFLDELQGCSEGIIKTGNQILISYYLSFGWFKEEDIISLKNMDEEDYWFQNYHLILYCEDLRNNLDASIKKYLIPKKVYEYNNPELTDREALFLDFYTNNLIQQKNLIRDVDSVEQEIRNYLELRFEFEEKMYEEKSV